jgi:hypothetical protein
MSSQRDYGCDPFACDRPAFEPAYAPSLFEMGSGRRKSQARGKPSDDKVCGHDIRRERNIVDVADAEQRADVGVVRLRAERINEEKHGVNSAFRDSRRNLSVTAFGSAEESLDLETDLVTHQLRGVSGRGERKLCEGVAVEGRPGDEIDLLTVMRDEG